MKDAYILAILLILLEARRMWAEYRLTRKLNEVWEMQTAPRKIEAVAASHPADPPQRDTSVIKMTAERDQRILEDDDD